MNPPATRPRPARKARQQTPDDEAERPDAKPVDVAEPAVDTSPDHSADLMADEHPVLIAAAASATPLPTPPQADDAAGAAPVDTGTPGWSWPWLAGAGLLGGVALAASGHGERASSTSNLTLTGTVLMGPVVPGNDLVVEALAADGKTVLARSAVDDQGGYRLAIDAGQLGAAVLLRVHSQGSKADVASESRREAVDLPGDLHAVLVLTDSAAAAAPVHVTQLTDLLARLLMKDDGSLGDVAAAELQARSRATARALGLEAGNGQTLLEQIDAAPTLAVDALGHLVDAPHPDLHGQLLRQMSLTVKDAASLDRAQANYAQDLQLVTLIGSDGLPTVGVDVSGSLAAALAAARQAMGSPGVIG